MANNILAQAAPGATTLTDIYRVSIGNNATLNAVTICNRSTSTSFRLAIARDGVPDDPKQYLYYDLPLSGNNTFAADLGIVLLSGDVVRGYAGSANLTFMLFGIEQGP